MNFPAHLRQAGINSEQFKQLLTIETFLC